MFNFVKKKKINTDHGENVTVGYLVISLKSWFSLFILNDLQIIM